MKARTRIQYLLTLLFASAAGLATADDAPRINIHVPVEQLTWMPVGGGGAMAVPVMAARVWGDIKKGAHGSLLRFPPGASTPAHTHSADYRAVVISGTMADGDPNGAPLNPGSFWFQKSGEAHITKCISSSECVVYVVQEAAFDITLYRGQ